MYQATKNEIGPFKFYLLENKKNETSTKLSMSNGSLHNKNPVDTAYEKHLTKHQC